MPTFSLTLLNECTKLTQRNAQALIDAMLRRERLEHDAQARKGVAQGCDDRMGTLEVIEVVPQVDCGLDSCGKNENEWGMEN